MGFSGTNSLTYCRRKKSGAVILGHEESSAGVSRAGKVIPELRKRSEKE
jgi:hypothetical protein